jgi:hypothetical protein
MKRRLPSIWRVALGFALAPAIPALLVALLASPGQGAVNALGFAAFLGIFYGLAPALVFGFPVFWVLREMAVPSVRTSMLVGAGVASIAPILAALTIGPGLLLLVPLAAVPLGAIGGFTFWLVTLRGLERAPVEPPSVAHP